MDFKQLTQPMGLFLITCLCLFIPAVFTILIFYLYKLKKDKRFINYKTDEEISDRISEIIRYRYRGYKSPELALIKNDHIILRISLGDEKFLAYLIMLERNNPRPISDVEFRNLYAQAAKQK